LNAIFGLQTDCAGSGDSYYPVRAFPLRHQIVCILGRLNVPKDKVAFLKAPGMNPTAVIATQGLLIACSTRSSPEAVLLKEDGIVMLVLLLLYFIVGKYSR
jgi:hypothetical protein